MNMNYNGKCKLMKNKIPVSASRQNRRSFLKSQAILGLGTLAAGMVIPVACASPRQPDRKC